MVIWLTLSWTGTYKFNILKKALQNINLSNYLVCKIYHNYASGVEINPGREVNHCDPV